MHPVDWSERADPWGGRQPRYERLLYRGPCRFFAQTLLPSGRRLAVRLASVSVEMRPKLRP
jgi:hypothetical protein